MPRKKNTDELAEQEVESQQEDVISADAEVPEATHEDESQEDESQEDEPQIAESQMDVLLDQFVDVKLEQVSVGTSCKCANHLALVAAKAVLDEVAALAGRVAYYPNGVVIRENGPEHDFAFPQPSAHAFKALLTKLNSYAGR